MYLLARSFLSILPRPQLCLNVLSHCLRILRKEFNSTLTIGGKCIAHASRVPEGVIECTVTPEVFDCVEEGRQ